MLFGCDVQVVADSFSRNGGVGVVGEECIVDEFLCVGVLWCVHLGDELSTVDITNAPWQDVNV